MKNFLKKVIIIACVCDNNNPLLVYECKRIFLISKKLGKNIIFITNLLELTSIKSVRPNGWRLSKYCPHNK